MHNLDFLFVGVGGQGILLASDIVAEVGLASGFDVKKSEIHGMSQRGGSVESFVRWGQRVASPIVEKGRVDALVAFELLESARWADFLAPDAVAVLNRQQLQPLATASGKLAYPSEQSIVELFRARRARLRLVDGTALARTVGSANVVNVVLLGVLSRELDVPLADWREAIKRRVPERFRELNERAFEAGRE